MAMFSPSVGRSGKRARFANCRDIFCCCGWGDGLGGRCRCCVAVGTGVFVGVGSAVGEGPHAVKTKTANTVADKADFIIGDLILVIVCAPVGI